MKKLSFSWILILLLCACAQAMGGITPSSNPTLAQTSLPTTTFTPQPPGTPTPGPTDLFITEVMATKYAAQTQYAALPTVTPTPTIPTGSVGCKVADLQTSYGVTASGQHVVVFISVKNISQAACFLPGWPAVQLRDQEGTSLIVSYEYITTNASPSTLPPTQAGAPGEPIRYGLESDQSAQFFLTWGNWCGGDVKGGVTLRVFLLDNISWLDIHTTVEGGGICDDSSSPSDIAVFGFGY